MYRTIVRLGKRYPLLVAQTCCGIMTVGLAASYLMRLATGPYVVWDKANNPEPWSKLDPTFQYKFMAVTTDYKNLKKDGPSF